MTDTPVSQQDEIRQAEVVSDYLPSGFTAGFDGTTGGSTPPQGSIRAGSIRAGSTRGSIDINSEEPSSLKLLGGDIHRDLYKIENRARLHQRAHTFSFPVNRAPGRDDSSMTAAEVQEPQGFRRQFVMSHRSFIAARTPVARNFVEFLDLYGAFAGEDLAESDDEELEGDEDERSAPTERRPLLGKRKSSRIQQGDAGTTKTFFTLIKAFIGTGIMFLPKAFNNGGLVFSLVTLITIALISMVAFHLLLSCRRICGGGGYGDIGRTIGGEKMRGVILASIVLSQLGFVCSAVIFVAQNFQSFFNAVTNGDSPLSPRALIAIQALLLIPFSFIRNISKLGPAALLADIFILIGLVYIWWFDIATLAKDGLHPSVDLYFNPSQYTLTIGASIFTFEGIGLILPIQSSMKKPQVFEWLLGTVMLINTTIFAAVGALCYATFGKETKIEIIDNYPQDNKLVNAVQFLYAFAVLMGTPVQLFPPIRILEGRFFKNLSGKKDNATKWKKNAFRTFLVVLCIAIAIGGESNLDRFVALIGSFACVPLVYIYPPLLHYKAVANTWYEKAGDIALMTLGVVGMIYTTAITLVNSFL